MEKIVTIYSALFTLLCFRAENGLKSSQMRPFLTVSKKMA